MDKVVNYVMTRLFQIAEYVYDKTSFVCGRKFLLGQASHKAEPRPQNIAPVPSKEIVPTIRFSNEDRMVEGELFK